ncbi:hypothetical protein KM043_005699 [Ampulex compressa]|nr:hypothetical protein KM043_005699 [Ampulex compressa]
MENQVQEARVEPDSSAPSSLIIPASWLLRSSAKRWRKGPRMESTRPEDRVEWKNGGVREGSWSRAPLGESLGLRAGPRLTKGPGKKSWSKARDSLLDAIFSRSSKVISRYRRPWS